MNVDDYKLLFAPSAERLELKVKQHISEGWTPIGGPVVLDGDGLLQAVVSAEPSRIEAARRADR